MSKTKSFVGLAALTVLAVMNGAPAVGDDDRSRNRELTIDVWERLGSDASVTQLGLGPVAGGPGTTILYTEPVYPSFTSTEAVGTLDGDCTAIEGNLLSGKPFITICSITINLPEGKLVFGGSIPGTTGEVMALLGGTGKFEAARGMLTVKDGGNLHIHVILW